MQADCLSDDDDDVMDWLNSAGLTAEELAARTAYNRPFLARVKNPTPLQQARVRAWHRQAVARVCDLRWTLPDEQATNALWVPTWTAADRLADSLRSLAELEAGLPAMDWLHKAHRLAVLYWMADVRDRPARLADWRRLMQDNAYPRRRGANLKGCPDSSYPVENHFYRAVSITMRKNWDISQEQPNSFGISAIYPKFNPV